MTQSTQPISPLRQRMIEDMQMRKLAPKTQTSYICAVKKLSDYLGHSPHTATRNRHCPKCQGSAAHRWLKARQADLLPVEYYHLVFTLPAPIRALAYSNPSVIYAILFKAVAETLRTIAADPKHLGARVGLTLVLHTWGSAMDPSSPFARYRPRWRLIA